MERSGLRPEGKRWTDDGAGGFRQLGARGDAPKRSGDGTGRSYRSREQMSALLLEYNKHIFETAAYRDGDGIGRPAKHLT
jgi:hypothetical protein